MKRKLIYLAGLAAAVGIGALASAVPLATANQPRRRIQANSFKQDNEIAEWNRAVDQRNQQKRQDKAIHKAMMQRRRG